MKTREEIEQEYRKQIDAVLERHMNIHQALIRDEVSELNVLAAARDAALAELDDPMARLIAAAKKVSRHGHGQFPHYPNLDLPVTGCPSCTEQIALQSAIDYAEQRRAQG